LSIGCTGGTFTRHRGQRKIKEQEPSHPQNESSQFIKFSKNFSIAKYFAGGILRGTHMDLRYRWLLVLSLGLTPLGFGQNFAEDLAEDSNRQAAVPGLGKVVGNPADEARVMENQHARNLEPRLVAPREGMWLVGTGTATSGPKPATTSQAAWLNDAALREDLARISAGYRPVGSQEKDCRQVSLSLGQRVREHPESVLELVEAEVKANPSCACEIVKSAIEAEEPDSEQLVAMVETAMLAAPEQTRLISQCAIAAAPEALASIQALLARYDGNGGESGSSAKSSKGAKAAVVAAASDEVAAIPNPLDFPGTGPIGPTLGGPGGQPLIPLVPPIIIPQVTEVDFLPTVPLPPPPVLPLPPVIIPPPVINPLP
jgi:hypothetical protein